MKNFGGIEIAGIIVLSLFLIAVVWVVRLFNRLIRFKALHEESWSGVLAVLKRRRDLIPNLVEIAAGYMSHESGTLEKIAEARSMGQAARSVAEMENAEMSMMSALAGFRIISENYPALKADANMMHIQQELSELEERIEKVRRYYNATVRDYNMEMDRFPANIVAGPMGFKRAKFFDTDEQSQQAPVIKLPKRGSDAPAEENSDTSTQKGYRFRPSRE